MPGIGNEAPIPQAHHRDITDDLDLDEEDISSLHLLAWNQNLRLILAIAVVILSAIFLWWFIS
ncbi:MAG: hypothetical protein K5657_03635 [Desulfovibrio sp.]|nr:hypothetical protein [Desulfovibrio sp.]